MNQERNLKSRRKWVGFFAVLIALALIGISASLSRHHQLAVLLGSLGALPAGLLGFWAKGLMNIQQAQERLREGGFHLGTFAIGALLAVVLFLMPIDWFAMIGLPFAGGCLGAAIKLYTVGQRVDSEYPDFD